MPTPLPAELTPPERRLLGLLVDGQTPAQAAERLHLTPEEADALLAELLRRHRLPSRHRLVACALLHRWL